jgi:hypothetical protein
MGEDVWNTHNLKEIRSGFEMMTKADMHRHNTWESKEAAQKYFLGRSPYKSWDPQIVELFVVSWGAIWAQSSTGLLPLLDRSTH